MIHFLARVLFILMDRSLVHIILSKSETFSLKRITQHHLSQI